MSEIDLNSPEIQAAIEKAAEERVAALKATNAALKAEKQKLAQKALTEAEIEEYHALKAEIEVREAKTGDLEGQLTRAQKKHAAELEAATKQVASLRTALERDKLDAAALKVLAESGANPELMMLHIRSRMALEEVDGEYVVRVKDAKGAIIDGDLTTLVDEYRANPNFAAAFKSPINPGGNAKPGVTAEGIVNPYKIGPGFSMTEQARLEATDPALAARLQQQVG